MEVEEVVPKCEFLVQGTRIEESMVELWVEGLLIFEWILLFQSSLSFCSSHSEDLRLQTQLVGAGFLVLLACFEEEVKVPKCELMLAKCVWVSSAMVVTAANTVAVVLGSGVAMKFEAREQNHPLLAPYSAADTA